LLDEPAVGEELAHDGADAFYEGQIAERIVKFSRANGGRLSMRDFRDQSGPVGRWAIQKKALEDFSELPLEMQQFISKPVNLPYLELAQRLSEMSVDRLRGVAEGLLEITL
jgi:hypothetical protein